MLGRRRRQSRLRLILVYLIILLSSASGSRRGPLSGRKRISQHTQYGTSENISRHMNTATAWQNCLDRSSGHPKRLRRPDWCNKCFQCFQTFNVEVFRVGGTRKITVNGPKYGKRLAVFLCSSILFLPCGLSWILSAFFGPSTEHALCTTCIQHLARLELEWNRK